MSASNNICEWAGKFDIVEQQKFCCVWDSTKLLAILKSPCVKKGLFASVFWV